MQLIAFIWLALIGVVHGARARVRDHDNIDYFALELHHESSPQQVAIALGLDYEGPLGELPGHHTFSSQRLKKHNADHILETVKQRRRKRDLTGLGELGGILWSQRQLARRKLFKRSLAHPDPRQEPPSRPVEVGDPPPGPGSDDPLIPGVDNEAVAQRNNVQKDLSIDDPIFKEQWHLFNAIQIGHDLNVTGVWQQGITGKGATAVMVDDGIDMFSNDIKDNYFAKGSYDFNDNTEEPKPRLNDDKHGTRCAGEIAAVRNNVCGVGVAYDAKIGGLRILSKIISDEDEAVAMNYAYQDNQIYSCSWGPPDDGKSMDAPGILIRKAMVNAVQKGRQGKGNLFVFAAGNGNGAGDNCNFDGYTNSIYTITIGGIDRKGIHGYYSEHCSAQLGVSYSSGSGDYIHTTDVGIDQCYTHHGGTSAAAPLAAGVFALALSARPELTWRDVQSIIVQTAIPVNEGEDSWADTFAGRKFSHAYGYGKIDAYALVEKAKSVDLLKPQAWYKSPWIHVKHHIPQGAEGLLSSFEIKKEDVEEANLAIVEHVTVTMNVEHTRRGDLSVELRSPTDVVSHLSVARRLDEAKEGYVDWTFMSVAHWGESGIGKWSVVVKDTDENDSNGTFTDWRITLFGECKDAKKQKPFPMPSEHDDDDHDIVSGSPTFVSVDASKARPTNLPALPSDHQDRPVNAKPTAAASQSEAGTTTSTASSSSSPSSSASSTSLPDVPPDEDTSDEHFLPHLFPTFGVSKRTQIWIYGALGIILLFCLALGAYLVVQRRKRKRRELEDYEFEELLDEDGNARADGRRSRRRAGELYDAFAGGSEDEDEGLLSEEEEDEEDEEEGKDEDGGSPRLYRDEPVNEKTTRQESEKG